MPSAKFVKKNIIPQSFRNEKVKGMFDIEKKEIIKEFNVNIPIENIDWNIGVIVGTSGSGKTTISKEVFKDFYYFEGFEWDNNKTILDNFNKKFSPKKIVEVLSKVGFSSPPDWLKSFNVLSNGQKMRVELARLILEIDKPVIYDEFTSVVDRQVAKVGSYAIAKYIRKENKKFIAVSCHFDILDWLEPDWIYFVDKKEFKLKKDLPYCRPKIELCIRKAKNEEWKMFSDYHYLSKKHNNSANKYIAEYNNIPVAWCSVIHSPHPKVKNIKRIHRIVVLPDYQGIGIGKSFLNKIAKMYANENYRIRIVTSQPVFIYSLNKSNFWKMIRKPSRITGKPSKKSIFYGTNFSIDRLTATFEYIKNN